MCIQKKSNHISYKSFSSGLDNIGDITAKGEAQGAVIDIIGMITGVLISEAVIHYKILCLAIYSSLVLTDIFCVFQEIRR